MEHSFIDLSHKRESVRQYLARPVEKEKIERCLEAARLAPSACNSQPWKFIIIDDWELKDSIAAQTTGSILPLNHFTRQVPVLAVLVMEQPNIPSRIGSKIKDKHFPLIDIGIAAEHFCLQAAEEGLGTCMIGWFNESRVCRLLKIPASSRPVLIIALGYPSEPDGKPKKRKPLEEISSWNKFS